MEKDFERNIRVNVTEEELKLLNGNKEAIFNLFFKTFLFEKSEVFDDMVDATKRVTVYEYKPKHNDSSKIPSFKMHIIEDKKVYY